MLVHREGWGVTYSIAAVQAFVTSFHLKAKNSAGVRYHREVMQ